MQRQIAGPQIGAITAQTTLLSGNDQVLMIDFTCPDAVEEPQMEIQVRIKSPPSDWVMRGPEILPYSISENLWRMGSRAVPKAQTMEVRIRQVMTRGGKMPWSPTADIQT